jgi:hypothetical protein
MRSLVFTDRYSKRAASFISQHPEVVSQYSKALQLLQINPVHPSLRPVMYEGRLSGVQSVSLNAVTLEMLVTDKEVVLISIS